MTNAALHAALDATLNATLRDAMQTNFATEVHITNSRTRRIHDTLHDTVDIALTPSCKTRKLYHRS